MVTTLPNDVFLPFAPDKPWLAPLAGWSDLPFRLLCRRFGAAVCCTEMISAKGLIYKSPGTAELFATCPEDGPVVVQLFGSEAPFMEAAAGQLRDKGFVWFDCNMGCSVPKVARTGSGAAMCKDIDNALSVAEALIRAAGRGRVGFKLRLGWDEPGRSPAAETWRVLAPALEALGAGWLTLHPHGEAGLHRDGALGISQRVESACFLTRHRQRGLVHGGGRCTLPRRNGRGYRHVCARGLAGSGDFQGAS